MTVHDITTQFKEFAPARREAGWSGSIAHAADGDGVRFVSGQWTVSGVVAPPGSQGVSACAARIGTDGVPPSTDILQAGTTQEIKPDAFGTRSSTCAWFE
jgi:hypothetical protein